MMNRIGNMSRYLYKFSNSKTITNVSLKGQYRKLYDICKPQYKKYIRCGIITLLHAATFMYLPNIYGDINTLMEIKISTSSYQTVYQTYAFIMAKWAVIFGSLGTLTYLRRYEFLDVSNRIAVRFRTVLYNHILNGEFFRKNQLAQTYVHHLVTDVRAISQFTGETLFMGIRGACFLLGGVGCLLYSSPYLSLICVGIMSLFNLIFRSRNTMLKSLKQQQNNALIKITEFVAEKFHSLRFIKISNTQQFQKYYFAKELQTFYNYSKKVSKANGINYSYLQGFGLFSLFSVAACGALLISLQLTSFSLIASSTYAMYVAIGFRSLISFNTQLMKMMAIYSNVQARVGQIHTDKLYQQDFLQDVLKGYEKNIQKLLQQRYPVKKNGIHIKISNLNFTYFSKTGENIGNIYQNFNLQIKPGQIVALIGPSGSGKSTLFNIITKLEEAQSGQIYIDGQSLNNLSFKNMQEKVSYVTQQNFLFRGSFRDNLKYGNQHFDCSDSRLIQCLKLTNAYDIVQNKGGLDELIQDKGSNLSGGEKQRIVLARALVKQPRLLLLDEGTSGIDSESQSIIIANLYKMRQNMTIVLITHKIEPFKHIITSYISLRD